MGSPVETTSLKKIFEPIWEGLRGFNSNFSSCTPPNIRLKISQTKFQVWRTNFGRMGPILKKIIKIWQFHCRKIAEIWVAVTKRDRKLLILSCFVCSRAQIEDKHCSMLYSHILSTTVLQWLKPTWIGFISKPTSRPVLIT